eukprot:TRINITY_DN67342_c2_g1_i1.p1 TRINITY_DN67342_c2_g1~~TRINITY_DN67342_c2_g1_i1.p1  ORF type:complete len:168 (-),score=14.55 TRINITY_DN67342_c2_g1_i1:255-758(-)
MASPEGVSDRCMARLEKEHLEEEDGDGCVHAYCKKGVVSDSLYLSLSNSFIDNGAPTHASHFYSAEPRTGKDEHTGADVEYVAGCLKKKDSAAHRLVTGTPMCLIFDLHALYWIRANKDKFVKFGLFGECEGYGIMGRYPIDELESVIEKAEALVAKHGLESLVSRK